MTLVNFPLLALLSAQLALAGSYRRSFSPYTPANHLRSYDGVEIPHVVRRQVPSSDDQYPGFDVLHHLSGIAPYFDSPGVGLQPIPPSGCEVQGAAYLLRHSDIYANDFDYSNVIEPFLFKLGNATDKSVFSSYPPLAFLSNWTSPITNATAQVEKVTPTGSKDAAALGKLFGKRYISLLNSTSPGNATNLTIWAASSSRSTETAQAFSGGLQNGTEGVTLQIIQENEDQGANTLTPHESCPAYSGSSGSEQSGAFLKVYAAAPAARLKANVPSFNFTVDDIIAMQQLCGYETVIRNSSDFCSLDLFTPEEWLGFEYTNDIMYNYNIGYGFDKSPVLGTPWLEASSTALGFNSSVNTTATQKLFLSFSHREEPAFVITALGLFNNTSPNGGNVNDTFPLDRINYNRAWKTSQILPFLGHVGIERLSCTSVNGSQAAASNSTASNSTTAAANSTSTFVRILVNSAPLPLPACAGSDTGPGGSCSLEAFQRFVQERSSSYGDFETACGTTNGSDVIDFYGNITAPVSSSTASVTSTLPSSSTAVASSFTSILSSIASSASAASSTAA